LKKEVIVSETHGEVINGKPKFGLALHISLDPSSGCIHNVNQIPVRINGHGYSFAMAHDNYNQDDLQLIPNLKNLADRHAGLANFGGINNGRSPGALTSGSVH